jgi:hypothetical protein
MESFSRLSSPFAKKVEHLGKSGQRKGGKTPKLIVFQ